MKTKLLVAILSVAIIVILVLAIWYSQVNAPRPTPSITPTPTTIPTANVTSDITITPIKNFNDTSFPQGDYLQINGNVTNDSSNIAYDVGLHISVSAVVISSFQPVIDVTVPIQSGTYNTNTNYNLTTLNPNQTINIAMTIYPNYQSQEPDLSNSNVTLVWSNMP